MENLFSYIIKSLAGEKYSDIKVRLINTESEIFLNIDLPSSLRNNLVGRDGKILNALRDYSITVSRKFGNKRVFIRINEI